MQASHFKAGEGKRDNLPDLLIKIHTSSLQASTNGELKFFYIVVDKIGDLNSNFSNFNLPPAWVHKPQIVLAQRKTQS
jgi:hypothetical protein